MNYLSTTSLASELGMPVNDLFAKLKTLGWIDRKNDKWVLTQLGKERGGQTRTNPKYGEYVVWPENIEIESGYQKSRPKLLNATALGKHFSVSSQRMNLILSELGWIQPDILGWAVTKLGKAVGGREYEHETSGASYVLWPEDILENKGLVGVFGVTQTEKAIPNTLHQKDAQDFTLATPFTGESFRDKFEAKHRTRDGHFVRSRAEVIIDDTLYDYGLVHAYEKKVPVEEDLYTDFYLPNGKVYIEFWGMEDDPKYAERKKRKLELYEKYELKLIQLHDSDISNLDDHLPKKLLKFGIKVY